MEGKKDAGKGSCRIELPSKYVETFELLTYGRICVQITITQFGAVTGLELILLFFCILGC